MRTFVVLGHTAPVTPEFSLDDLPGGAGRLDVLCRCVNAAFTLSHAIREDVELWLVLQDSVSIRLVGRELRYLGPDERNIASLLRSALEATSSAVGEVEVESTPGIYVAKRGFEAVLSAYADMPIVQLHESGEPIRSVDPAGDAVFVLSDHQEFTERETEVLASAGAAIVSIGPVAVHAENAITVVQNYLDTDGYETYTLD